jgi:NAD(P)-dependent dehydrogenase (short-subunit alcohol dehydrogenase family)
MDSFTNRVVLITGAASGIGRQLALTLADQGAVVAALDQKSGALDALAAELRNCGKRCGTAIADVTDAAGVRAAVADLETQLGPTDVLIASAGIGRATPATDFVAEEFAAHINVNLIGVANSVAAVLPGMRERRRGHLVALSSLASYRGLPVLSAYCASKAGVNALFDSLRVELRPYGIACTTICPGYIRTPMTEALDSPPPNMMELKDAVRHMIAAVRARKSFVAFPRPTVWRMRLLRYLPHRLSDWLAHRVLVRILRRK